MIQKFVNAFLRINYIFVFETRSVDFSVFNMKNVIIFGGSSGLGLEVAKQLKNLGCIVTILARDPQKLTHAAEKYGFCVIKADASDFSNLNSVVLNHQIVISCIGKCISRFVIDHSYEEVLDMVNTNFIANFNILKLVISSKNKPEMAVFVSSTLSLNSLPGYAIYSGTKSALDSMILACRYEPKTCTELKIYNVSTILTKGFDNENINKPEIVKRFEDSTIDETALPVFRANRLINQFFSGRTRLYSDFFTYLMVINEECEFFGDFLMLPIAIFFNICFRIYVKYFFQTYKELR